MLPEWTMTGQLQHVRSTLHVVHRYSYRSLSDTGNYLTLWLVAGMNQSMLHGAAIREKNIPPG